MPDALTTEDRAFLARAISVAERARGSSGANPPVGCVLVRDGQVVAEGATEPAGGPHAEVVALEEAGRKARESTAYVTLTPCAHHGRTGPCTDALVAAGVARVVVGFDDPNPIAAGGARRLRSYGIVVDVARGPLRATIARQLEGFLVQLDVRRPHVTLKLAQTTAGELHAPGERRWVTGLGARRAVHTWRSVVDAVMVGSGTVLADDPLLTVRGIDARRPGGPRAVVVDSRLRIPPSARVCRPGTIVMTVSDRDPTPLTDTGAHVVRTGRGPDGRVDLHQALSTLLELGIGSVLAEPGLTLANALLEADLVDRLVLHIAEGDEQDARRAVDTVAGRWHLERSGGAGPDAIIHLLRRRSAVADREVA